jgi:1,4-alpha-glucan branching enzyme
MDMPKTKKRREPVAQASSTNCRPAEVEFVLDAGGVEHAYVCGDFNNWQPTSLRMIGNPDAGLWEKRLTLPPGRYEYKFFVDGNWLHDPDAMENVPNQFGTLNSVLEVRPK